MAVVTAPTPMFLKTGLAPPRVPVAVPTPAKPVMPAPPVMPASQTSPITLPSPPPPKPAGPLDFAGLPAPIVIADDSPNAGLPLPGTITQAQAEAKPDFAGAAAPIDDGIAANVAAGANEGIIGLATAIPWLYQSAQNAGQYMLNVNTGRNVDENMPYPNADGGRQVIVDLMKKVGIHDPNDTKAVDFLSKVSRAAAEAGTSWAIPEATVPRLVKAAESAGIVGPQATKLAEAIVGEGNTGTQVAKDAAVAAGFGAASSAADQAPVPEQWKPLTNMAAGMAGAVATHALGAGAKAAARGVGNAASDILAPVIPVLSRAEEKVGKTLNANATDAAAARQALRDEPADSPLTTAQATGDMGLLSEERAAAAREPGAFMQKRADANQANIDAIQRNRPANATPEAVATSMRDHLRAIDEQTAKDMDAATKAGEAHVAAARQAAEQGAQDATTTAQAHAEAVGQGAAPDVTGDAIRQKLEAARAAAKDHERAVWNAVDPTGKLALGTSATTDAAARIPGEIAHTAKPPDGEEAAIFKTAAELQPTESLNDIQALQARTKAAMREERFKNGETPAYRRLTQLNEALYQDLETAVSGKVAEDRQLVAAGKMRVEDTVEARIQRQVDEWYANRSQARATGTDGALEGPGGGSAGSAGAPRAAGEGGPGLGDAGRAGGLPADAGSPAVPQSSFDQAALDRLTAARATTKQRVETFDNKALSPIRRRPSTVSPYDMPAAAVPAKVFNSRPQSADAIAKLRAAIGDEEALSTLEPYAVDRLHKVAMRDDGTLDPGKTQAWLRNHSDALAAFPELEARVRRAADASVAVKETVARGKDDVAAAEKKAKTDTAASAKTADTTRREAEAGAIGKLVGAETPEDVARAVGRILDRDDAARELARVRAATKGDKTALDGLKAAIVDHILSKFVSNTEAGASGVGLIKADAFQTFVRKSEAALRAAGFSTEEIASFKMIAQRLQQMNRSIVAVKLPGGSNTVQDLLAVVRKGGFMPVLKVIGTSLLAEGGALALQGGGWGIAAAVATGLVTALKEASVKTEKDLLGKALRDPKLALRLMEKAAPQTLDRQVKGIIPMLVAAFTGGRKPKGVGEFVKDESGAGRVANPAGEAQYQANEDGSNAPRDAGGKAGERGVRAQAPDAAAEPRAGGREADGSLRGLPRNVGGSFRPSSFHEGQVVAERYMREAGLPYHPPNTYAKVDPARAKRIADAYDEMQHAPQDPKVKAAYQAMADETLAQYKAILDTGMKFDFIKAGEEDPYHGNPRNMTEDVRNNHHMWVFPTKDGFGSDVAFDVSQNPLLADTEFKISGQTATVNDVFRAVHDYFGHVKEGVGFRADGEENAWRSHSSMYSPEARKAMTTETRGQNSWVNYGPFGEANKTANSEDTHYADQKIGILPDWVISEGAGDEPPGGSPLKKWFGDSKVVDAKGEPLTVYHGTTKDFDSFRPNTRKGESLGFGIHFAADKEFADQYGPSGEARRRGKGGRVIEAHLKIENPLHANEMAVEGSPEFNLAKKLGGEVYHDARDGKSKIWIQGAVDKADPKAAGREIRAAGYDGVEYFAKTYDGMDGRQSSRSFVVFDPQQVKSTDNHGTFDLSDPRMQYQAAYHGTPHDFDTFDSGKIGTGEGAQAFGHGLYFAGNKKVAEHYKKALTSGAANWTVDGAGLGKLHASLDAADRLKYEVGIAVRGGRSVESAIDYVVQQKRGQLASRRVEPEDVPVLRQELSALEKMRAAPPAVQKNEGHLHEVDVPEDDELMDWDKPLSDQPKGVQKKLAPLVQRANADRRSSGVVPIKPESVTGRDFYGDLSLHAGEQAYRNEIGASKMLKDAGIPGHRYLDRMSRNPKAIADARGSLAVWEKALEKSPSDPYIKSEVDARRQELSDLEGEASHNYVIYDDSRITPLAKYRAGKDRKLPRADVDELVDIVKKVSGLLDVGAVDTIELPSGAPEWGIKGPTTAAGMYHPVQDAVTLAMDSATPRTAFHEAFHRLQNRFLTIKERAVLRGEAERLRGIVGEGADKLSQSELEAEAFAIYSTDPDVPVGGLPAAIRAGWDRMVETVRKVRNFLAGKGYTSAKSIFDEAKSGGIAKREPHAGMTAEEQTKANDLVKTPAFKRWFGGSTVVDKQSEPLVVYHGTADAGFDEFRPGSFFSESPDESSAYTFWRSMMKREAALTKRPYVEGASPELAGRRVPYAGIISDAREQFDAKPSRGDVWATDEAVVRFRPDGKTEFLTDLVPVYDKSPGSTDTIAVKRGDARKAYRQRLIDKRESLDRHYTDAARVKAGAVYPVYLSIKNPKVMGFLEANRLGKRLGATDEGISAEIAKLKAQGFDGIETVSDEGALHPELFNGQAPRQWIVFDPGQVKSVFNRGTFDPKDSRIQYSPKGASRPKVVAPARL